MTNDDEEKGGKRQISEKGWEKWNGREWKRWTGKGRRGKGRVKIKGMTNEDEEKGLRRHIIREKRWVIKQRTKANMAEEEDKSADNKKNINTINRMQEEGECQKIPWEDKRKVKLVTMIRKERCVGRRLSGHWH